MPSRISLCVAGAVAMLATRASAARGWTVGSSLTDPCHERITYRAIQGAGWSRTPPALTEAERRIADDVPADLPGGSHDRWTLTALLGVRHADVQGHEPSDIIALSREAARPEAQPQHCLRNAQEDGEAGSRQALADCRGFIVAQVEAAIGEGATPGFDARETRKLGLDFRGPVEVEVNRFAFRTGLALHAMQDGFSHTLRTPDFMRVTHVLNYVEPVRGTFDEAQDGVAHSSYLDQCSEVADVRRRAFDAAVEASASLLAATTAPAESRRARLDRVQASVEAWLGYEPGCTLANNYCDDASLQAIPSGCAVGGWDGGTRASWPWLVAGACWLIGRRRRKQRLVLSAAILALVALTPMSVDASTPASDIPESSDSEDSPAEDLEMKQTQAAPVERGFGLQATTGVSVNDGAAIFAVGARYDLHERFTLGLDAEFNPWWSAASPDIELGTANAYLTGIIHWGALGPVELRSSLHAGASVLLFNLVGADRGHVGPFFGVTPLGIALRLGRHVKLVADPGGIFVSMPQTSTPTLLYEQHRFTAGIRYTP